jgi:hypothetical protein
MFDKCLGVILKILSTPTLNWWNKYTRGCHIQLTYLFYSKHQYVTDFKMKHQITPAMSRSDIKVRNYSSRYKLLTQPMKVKTYSYQIHRHNNKHTTATK